MNRERFDWLLADYGVLSFLDRARKTAGADHYVFIVDGTCEDNPCSIVLAEEKSLAVLIGGLLHFPANSVDRAVQAVKSTRAISGGLRVYAVLEEGLIGICVLEASFAEAAAQIEAGGENARPIDPGEVAHFAEWARTVVDSARLYARSSPGSTLDPFIDRFMTVVDEARSNGKDEGEAIAKAIATPIVLGHLRRKNNDGTSRAVRYLLDVNETPGVDRPLFGARAEVLA